MEKQLATPILYLVFNRLDEVKKTFPEIVKQRPKKLFIACDGPRTEKEKEKTDSVREYILKNINWKCEVKTLFRKKNLGCKYAVSGAIDWFFENVEQGIILEDDCLPDQSFFRYCEELLEKYKDKKRVISISGYNYLEKTNIKESYFFSRYFECCGWASWKRSWDKFDSDGGEYDRMKKEHNINKIFSSFLERIIFLRRFESVANHKVDSWAYGFQFTHFKERGFSVHPKINMIKVGGFSGDSTHTKPNRIDKRYISIRKKNIKFPLKTPNKILNNKKIDKLWLYKELKRMIFKRLLWN